MPNGIWDNTRPSFKELKTRGDIAMAVSRELIKDLHDLLEEHHQLHERFVESHRTTLHEDNRGG